MARTAAAAGGGVGRMIRYPPLEEAQHLELIADQGMYDADWAVAKVLELSDVIATQNRLLLTKTTVRGGTIPKLLPELEELREDGKNAQNMATVTMLNAERVEEEVNILFLNSNKAYRINGSGWRRFVVGSGLSRGDRFDLYTCRRRCDGGRCLFVFRSDGGGGGGVRGNARGWRRVTPPRLLQVDDEYDGTAARGRKAQYGSVARSCPTDPSGGRDQKRAKRDYNVKKEDDHMAKRVYNVKKEVYHMDMGSVIDDVNRKGVMHACTGGDHVAAARSSKPVCRKGRDEMTREKEKKAPRNLLWDSATELEKQAAIGLLKLAWDCYWHDYE